jgi:hypothetical protein
MAEEKIKFDGICRITSVDGVREKQWSGVAISETQVVSVWHPEEAGEVFLEFAEQKHGSKTRIRIAANVRKLNRRADLALIEFKVPRYVKIATYKVKRRDASKVTIRGYVNQTPMVIKDASLVRDTDTSDGFRLDRFDAPAMSGLSGSGAFEDPEFVVGIQTAGNDQLLTVPGDVVLDFISGEVGDER